MQPDEKREPDHSFSLRECHFSFHGIAVAKRPNLSFFHSHHRQLTGLEQGREREES